MAIGHVPDEYREVDFLLIFFYVVAGLGILVAGIIAIMRRRKWPPILYQDLAPPPRVGSYRQLLEINGKKYSLTVTRQVDEQWNIHVQDDAGSHVNPPAQLTEDQAKKFAHQAAYAFAGQIPHQCVPACADQWEAVEFAPDTRPVVIPGLLSTARSKGAEAQKRTRAGRQGS